MNGTSQVCDGGKPLVWAGLVDLAGGLCSPRQFDADRAGPYDCLMSAISIDLPPELGSFIAGKIANGEYANASEAVSALLRSAKMNEDRQKDAVATGIEEADRGDFVPFDAERIKARGREILASRLSHT